MTAPIVLVRWLDARGALPDWKRLSDLTDGPVEIRSLGYLVGNHPDHLVIAPHVVWEEDPEDRDACGVMWIPRTAVIEMTAWSGEAP